MATLTVQIVAEVMRQRLNLPDASKATRFINGIPEALKETARKVAANPQLRPLLLTDKTSTFLPLTAGKGSLADLYTGYQVLLEYLDKGHIYYATKLHPLRRVPIQVAGIAQQLTDFIYYYIDGPYIIPFTATGVALTGSLSFAVPYFPTQLGGLPVSEEVQNIFFDKLYEWALSDQAPGNDGAQDGDK